MPGWVGGRGVASIDVKGTNGLTFGEATNILRKKWTDLLGHEVNFGIALTPDMSVPGGIPLTDAKSALKSYR
jgi:hypothetical protein